ncbi:uncharacterized protein LOC131311585 [Rhododendron vialii]|uniref:uncharacterized protein LOC131311585 n=1 Tax=Rhododendron vialii TaxID=182163 RepID=UPI00265F0473|nr:uncharacterized protein LOC131311585 [Rhododendron vialii]
MHAFEYPGKDPRFNESSYEGFEQVQKLVDVDGGLGVTLNLITSKYPHIKGVNFDLTHVIQHAPPYPEDLSDDNVDFNEVLSKLRRSRGHKVEWEFEADMLAAFGKDPELCMKGICALYRKQTADEKIGKFTYYSNQQGFSHCDALRGSILAKFLTEGDPQGDVKKSVEELREYDPKAPELCRTLATHYSKQLFAIYKSKEDPLFLLS